MADSAVEHRRCLEEEVANSVNARVLTEFTERFGHGKKERSTKKRQLIAAVFSFFLLSESAFPNKFSRVNAVWMWPLTLFASLDQN